MSHAPIAPVDQPLTVKVENDQLVIRIGIDTLAHAAANCERFYDDAIHQGPPYVTVLSNRELAEDVVRKLNHEQEDGTTPVHVLLDDAIEAAYEDGSLAFENSDAKGTAQRAALQSQLDVGAGAVALVAELTSARKRIWCAVRNLAQYEECGRDEPGPLAGPVWAKVSHVLGVGSTLAHSICRENGIDPDTGKDVDPGGPAPWCNAEAKSKQDGSLAAELQAEIERLAEWGKGMAKEKHDWLCEKARLTRKIAELNSGAKYLARRLGQEVRLRNERTGDSK